MGLDAVCEKGRLALISFSDSATQPQAETKLLLTTSSYCTLRFIVEELGHLLGPTISTTEGCQADSGRFCRLAPRHGRRTSAGRPSRAGEAGLKAIRSVDSWRIRMLQEFYELRSCQPSLINSFNGCRLCTDLYCHWVQDTGRIV